MKTRMNEWMNDWREENKIKFVYNFISLSLEIHTFPLACQSFWCTSFIILSSEEIVWAMIPISIWKPISFVQAIASHCIQKQTPHPLRHSEWHRADVLEQLRIVYDLSLPSIFPIENSKKKV